MVCLVWLEEVHLIGRVREIGSEVGTEFKGYNKLNRKGQQMHLFKKQYPPEYLSQCTVIDKKYRVLFTLGEGRYAKVKMAICMNNNEKVAIKIMKTNAKSITSLLDAFVNQVSILSDIEHKSIVHVKDFEINGLAQKHNGKSKRIVYYTMSLAEYGELLRVIEQTDAFSEKLARYYFRQLVDGIQFLHDAGYCHRDIKAENLLIDVNYRLKIADFGFACTFTDQNSHKRLQMDPKGRAVGSPQTNAPQITNCSHEYYGDDVDLFAAGCILFYMVVKAPPFKSSNFKDECYSVFMNEDKAAFWKIFSGIAKPTKQFKDLIERLLEANPKKRIKLDEVKNHEWYKGELPEKGQFMKEVQYRFKKVGNILRNERETFIKSKLKMKQSSPRNCMDPDDVAPFQTPRELLNKITLLKSRLHDSESDGSSSDRRTNEDKKERYQTHKE